MSGLPYPHPDPGEPPHPAFFDHRPFVTFDESGRLLTGGVQALAITENARATGRRQIVALDAAVADEAVRSAHYVDMADRILKPRPTWPDAPGGALVLAAGEEREIMTIPAAEVTIDGPTTSAFHHAGGALPIGFSIPGTYTVSAEIWPYRPIVVNVTVARAAS